MTNEQRRQALAKARRKALEYAEAADREAGSPEKQQCIKLADMWAHVAQCMKTGGAMSEDGVIADLPFASDHNDVVGR